MEILILIAIPVVLALALASNQLMQIGLLIAWVSALLFVFVAPAQWLWRWLRPFLGL